MTYDDVFAPNYIGYGLDGSGALDSLGLFAVNDADHFDHLMAFT